MYAATIAVSRQRRLMVNVCSFGSVLYCVQLYSSGIIAEETRVICLVVGAVEDLVVSTRPLFYPGT